MHELTVTPVPTLRHAPSAKAPPLFLAITLLSLHRLRMGQGSLRVSPVKHLEQSGCS
jgi:hypothetical protein